MADNFDQFEKENRELFLRLFLFQLYLQQVKIRFHNQFAALLEKVTAEFFALANSQRYQTFDGFSKAELRRFIFRLQQAQANFFSIWTQQLIAALQGLAKTDYDASSEIYTATFAQSLAGAAKANEFDTHVGRATAQDQQALWSKITNQPITANGLLPIVGIRDLVITHSKQLQPIIRRAYVNAWTPTQVRDELQKRLNVQQNQWNTMTDAVIQHIHAFTTAAVGSLFLGAYMWCSILDEKTTEFCIEHDGRVYANGKGPIPPGHWGCRAHTMPVDVAQAAVALPSLSDYIGTLPVGIQEQINGAKAIRGLTDGEFLQKMRDMLKG